MGWGAASAAKGARAVAHAAGDAACAEAAAVKRVVPAKLKRRWSSTSRIKSETSKRSSYEYSVDVSSNLQHGAS